MYKRDITKKDKLIILKSVIASFLCTGIMTTSGCSDVVSASDYYVVSTLQKNGKNMYTICRTRGPFENSDDIEYISITDNKTIGYVCSNGNDNDYQTHTFNTRFISKFQIAKLSDVIDNDIVLYDRLLEFAKSKDLYEASYNYFSTFAYPLSVDFGNEKKYKADLQLISINSKNIIGYDFSPNKEFNTKRYIYSIIDNAQLSILNDEVVFSSPVKNYIPDYVAANGYLTYSDAEKILNDSKTYKLVKTKSN